MSGTVPNTITPGQVKDLGSALLHAIPLDMGSNVAQAWIGNKSVLQQNLRSTLCPPQSMQERRSRLFNSIHEPARLMITREINPKREIFSTRKGLYVHSEVKDYASEIPNKKLPKMSFEFCVFELLHSATYAQIKTYFKYHFSWSNVGGLMSGLVNEFEYKDNHYLSLTHQNVFVMSEVLYLRWGEGSHDWHVNTDMLSNPCEAGSYIFAPMALTLD